MIKMRIACKPNSDAQFAMKERHCLLQTLQTIQDCSCGGGELDGKGKHAIADQLLGTHAGEPAEYLLIDGHLQEVNWYKERYRSWFVGDSVQEDGSMYLCTPVDPLFLALPLLESSRMQVITFFSSRVAVALLFYNRLPCLICQRRSAR